MKCERGVRNDGNHRRGFVSVREVILVRNRSSMRVICELTVLRAWWRMADDRRCWGPIEFPSYCVVTAYPSAGLQKCLKR